MEKARKPITTQHSGAAGEHLVCFDFLARGLSGTINPFPGSPVDVFVEFKHQIIGVQIKSTLKPEVNIKENGFKNLRYVFRIARNSSVERYGTKAVQLFAFVALDLRQVYYIAAEDVYGDGKSKYKTFTVKSFALHAPDSLDRFLSRFL